MKKYYKIIDVIDNQPLFLYHGVNGTRKIPLGVWLSAKRKRVFDGSNGTKYLSGFHIFKDFETASKYLRLFRKPYKQIIEVNCKKIRKKRHSKSLVYLADKIMFKTIV